MRRFHYPGLTSVGFYGVTAMPLIASKGTMTEAQVTSDTLCRVSDTQLAWVNLTPSATTPQQ